MSGFPEILGTFGENCPKWTFIVKILKNKIQGQVKNNFVHFWSFMKFSGILEIPSGISPELGMFCLIWQYGIFFPLNFSHRAQFCTQNM